MKIYCDYKKIYNFNSDDIIITFPIVEDNDQLIITGTHISEFNESNDFVKGENVVSFVNESFDKSQIAFYSVPFVDIFAYDKNGYYATLGDFTNESSEAEIVYIDHSLKTYFVAKNFSAFVETLISGDLKKIECIIKDLRVYNSYHNAKKNLHQLGDNSLC